MTVNPEDIQLNPEQKRLLAECAEKNGKPWQSILQQALRLASTDEVDVDEEIRAVFGMEPEALEEVSLEEMQQILAKCSGSLAVDISADREERL